MILREKLLRVVGFAHNMGPWHYESACSCVCPAISGLWRSIMGSSQQPTECFSCRTVICGDVVAIDAAQEFTPVWYPAFMQPFMQWNHIILTLEDGPDGCAWLWSRCSCGPLCQWNHTILTLEDGLDGCAWPPSPPPSRHACQVTRPGFARPTRAGC